MTTSSTDDSNSQTERWVVCPCKVCNGRIEFLPAHVGETIPCPHCVTETVLFMARDASNSSGEASSNDTVPPVLERRAEIIVTTGNDVSGYSIEQYLGIVRGIVVRSPDVVQRAFGGFKELVGGNIESYASACETARDHAFERMLKHARNLTADAIICMRYDATEFAPGTTEVLAYGTAVKVRKSSMA